jgi:integrase
MNKKQAYSLTFSEKEKRWFLFYYLGDQRKGTRAPRHLTKAEQLEAWAKEFVRERQAGEGILGRAPAEVPKGPTVRELGARWLELREDDSELTPATVKDNRSHMNKHILPRFGDVPLAALEKTDLRTWVRELKANVAPNTCRNIVSTMRTFVDDAMGENWVTLPNNPTADKFVAKELPKAGNRSKEILSLPPERAQKLVDDPRIEARRRVRYMVAFCTGLRDGEISGLTWNDIVTSSEVPYLRVDKAIALYSKKGRLGQQKPKTDDSTRKVPIHPELLKALDWWGRDGWEMFMGYVWQGNDYVFASNHRRHAMAERSHMSRPDSAELIREDLALLGLPTEEGGQAFTFHATRRSFATWLTDAGAPEADIQHLLGHSQSKVLHKNYTTKVLRRLFETMSRIELRWQMQTHPVESSSLLSSLKNGSSRRHCSGAQKFNTTNRSWG